MATCNSGCDSKEKREERRKQVMLGDLPSNFLRVTPISAEQQLALDEQAALALQQQFNGHYPTPVAGRLTVSIIEAKLNKNYGLARMDPYVRIRIGQTIYETNTDYNGAKNPKWNKLFNCFLYPHDTSIQIDIFDECSFSLDEKIAWATYDMPENVLRGETADEWIELSGKLGEGKEGQINLVITVQPIHSRIMFYDDVSGGMGKTITQTFYKKGYPECPTIAKDQKPDVLASIPVPPEPEPVSVSEEDLKQIKEMFPNIEDEVVNAILESNSGNKDLTINALLALSEGT